MVDISYEIKKFKAIDIASLPTDEIYGDNVRLAFALYNKAIKKIEEGYDDLGRLDLRKSLQLYPSFNLAIMLLAMSTFASGDRIGAVRLFNSVKEPGLRKRALSYLDYLANEADSLDRKLDRAEIKEEDRFAFEYGKPVEQKEFFNFELIEVDNSLNDLPVEAKPIKEEVKVEIKEKIVEEEVEQVYQEIERQEETQKKSKPYAIYLLLSFVIILFFFLFLNKSSDNKRLNKEIKDLKAQMDIDINIPKKSPDTTEPATSDTAKETPVPIDYHTETREKIKACIKHFNFRQYFEVVEIYHTIKQDYIPEADKANLEKIYKTSLANFTSQNYNTHFNLSTSGKYDEVVEVLLPILKYNPDYSALDAVTFYIAKAYHDGKNIPKAKEYYQMVVDNYPNTSYSNWASYSLKTIG